jgi:hypothetical protein
MQGSWVYRDGDETPDPPRHPPTEVVPPQRDDWRAPRYSQTQHLAQLNRQLPREPPPQRDPQPTFKARQSPQYQQQPYSGYGAAQTSPQPQYTPQPRLPAPRRSKPGRASRILGWLVVGTVAIVALIVIFSPSGGGSPSSAPTATASAVAKPSASPSCTLTTTFDYIERTTEPGLQPQADEIGNVDCTGSLSDFAAEAGQAEGECTTIAVASDNPGYNVNEIPAPPLKGIIESAGPGC